MSFKSIRTAVISTAVGIFGYVLYKTYMKHESKEEQLSKLQKLFETGEQMQSAKDAEGVCARIKCMKPNDSNSVYYFCGKHRPFSFVVGKQGIYKLNQCKSDYERLISLGLTQKWIKLQLKKGYSFELLLFPEAGVNYQCFEATWDGIFDLFKQSFPEIYERMKNFKNDLKTKSYDEIESLADFEFFDVEQAGFDDPRYMNKERFLSIKKEDISLVNVRLLLYCFVCLNKYFTGSGFTVDTHGNVGCKEYLVHNIKLISIVSLKRVKLRVEL
eukprot:231040_1